MRLREITEPVHTFYHGSHRDHLDSFLKDGIKATAFNPRKPVCLTPRADVAFGYACMGGEGQWMSTAKAGSKPKTIPPEERLILTVEIPDAWYREHLVSTSSPTDLAPEVVFDATIPPEFITDHRVGRPASS